MAEGVKIAAFAAGIANPRRGFVRNKLLIKPFIDFLYPPDKFFIL
jgi:hypothetical protein